MVFVSSKPFSFPKKPLPNLPFPYRDVVTIGRNRLMCFPLFLKDTVDNKARLAPPSHIKTTSSLIEYMHILFFFFYQRGKQENKDLLSCLAASNFSSGHPWEPYIFTYGKLSLDFMGCIVLGFCEKRRSENLTVCGKTEQERDVLIPQFFCCDMKNRSKPKVMG